MSMTAYQKVKWIVILRAHSWANIEPPEITAENVDELYEKFDECNCEVGYQMQDSRSEIRGSGRESDLDTPYSQVMRHYEYYEVAMQAPDGSWVGWTYWYGGGKHSEPDAIPWMEYAYDVECQEREVTIIEKTFTKRA